MSIDQQHDDQIDEAVRQIPREDLPRVLLEAMEQADPERLAGIVRTMRRWTR